MQKWKAFVAGDEKRQAILAKALEWVSKGNVRDYLKDHRYSSDIAELTRYLEYVLLGGESDKKLLKVRIFGAEIARKVYRRQTEEAKTRGVSNCPDCANGHEANARRIYAFNEMEADHVSAWSRGGDTTEANCQMLCKTHNRAKGNR